MARSKINTAGILPLPAESKDNLPPRRKFLCFYATFARNFAVTSFGSAFSRGYDKTEFKPA